MDNQQLIQQVNLDMGLALPGECSLPDLRERVEAVVEQLIATDFEKLVNILYRVDVNEDRLKWLLQENVGAPVARIIADLIIDRQLEKMATRRQFHQRDEDISEEDRW